MCGRPRLLYKKKTDYDFFAIVCNALIELYLVEDESMDYNVECINNIQGRIRPPRLNHP